MEALTELCDLIAQNPSQFLDKIAWICNRCPPSESLLSGSPRISRSQLNAVLVTARFISKCGNYNDTRPRTIVLEFIRAIPATFDQSFWPKSFGNSSIASFYAEFFGYVCKATELHPDFDSDVASFMGDILFAAVNDRCGDVGISKAFLSALSESFPPIIPSDANKLVSSLLDGLEFALPSSSSPKGIMGSNSSSQSSPISVSNVAASSSSSGGIDDANSKALITNGGSSSAWTGMGTPTASDRRGVAYFEDELVENLEKQEIAFKLIGHILDRAQIDPKLLERVHVITKDQLKSISAFLKIRKREWTEQGSLLKARINTKLSVYKAAVKLKIRGLASLDSDGKSSKKLLHGALALLVESAEACVYSVWRKLRICEDLFGYLLDGISKIAVTRGGHLLRVLFIRFKPLVLTTCAQADTWASSQGAMFESVLKASCEIIEYGWTKDRAPVDTFIMGLATSIRERHDYEEEDAKEKQAVPIVQLNVIRLLAELNVQVKKTEVVDTILPLFIESLEEGDASIPGLLRLRLLDAVSRIASLGFEKSYREAVVLMIRSYLSKLSSIGSAESKTLPAEANTERVETLPAGFQSIARGLTNGKLRVDFRHRLLSLCSDVGLAAESKSGSSGADFLGPLLPAVAEICSDFDPTTDVEPSLLKLFRNLWFYIALFGLAPPVLKSPTSVKLNSTTLNNGGNTSAVALQAVGGPYMWNPQWSSAVQRISQGTPPLVVSSVKWLEDELELNALHNPGSRRGNGNEKAAVSQRTALSASLGGRVEVGAMSTISGVKATYLLAVAFLEIIRFSSNGGILNGPSSTASRSAFSCVFEYLKSPNLMPAVFQCLMAIVHRSFETALTWLESQICETGDAAEVRESTLAVHACFLIKSLSLREEHIRDVSINLLSQLRERFPQILWKSSCLDSLLFSVNNDPPSALVSDPALIASVRSLYQKVVREWIIVSLSYAPCTSQGLLQEQLCKANTWQKAQPTTDVVSLLSEIRIGTGKSDCWTGTKTANIPAVMASAAAASGGNLKLTEAFNIEVLSTAIVSATVKCNHAGEIAGMTRLYENMESADDDSEIAPSSPAPDGISRLITGSFPQPPQPKKQSFGEILLNKFVRLLQKFVSTAEKGGGVDKSSFRETCSQATALLLSNLTSNTKPSAESFSQLLRLLCWCPAYISTPDAMETGVFIWTWLVSAAPQLGSVVLAELVDAWLWTIDTKRGLFASEVRFFGPAAKLRPQLAPGEPEASPEKDPVQEILAHRLWLGFFIDRFEVVRHNSVEQLLLLGRMLQGTTKFPWRFSRHPAATGTFFTVMLLGLKLCSCQCQGNLQKFRLGLQLLEDRIYRASLGWFCHQPEWYETNNGNFAHSEAQSVYAFVQFLLNQRMNVPQNDSKGQGQENGNALLNMKDSYHPVWGSMENNAVGREKRKQLLLMLCQHEAERLDVWAQPIGSKESTSSRPKINSEKWIEHARTAFAIDPRIAFSLGARFPTNSTLKAELTQLVQSHILEIRTIPEALPYFVTPKAVDEDSPLLQQLTHWAACSITQALEYFTPAYKGHPRVMAYILRVLESYPPSRVTFFMPQLIQALRYDDEKLVEGYLIRAAQRSDVFSHILIWHLQGETCAPEQGKEAVSAKTTAFLGLLPVVREHIIDGFSPKARDIFRREFDFFEKVTSISGVLYPLPKEERRAGIRRELEKIQVDGADLYLPTAPNKLVRGIQVNSGIPLQSAAKVPIMITFDVADRYGDPNDIKPQACIFKVGDDCRQDVLALQVISLLKDIFEAVGLDLYLFPYGVLPTDPERGIIEVVPNTRSRSQMGETTDGGLYEIFQQDFGAVGSPSFEAARHNFIISSAGYAVASLLLQPKDRHNGNLLFDNEGRLVHIDFGFILETSPGGNMRFESAHFKLSHEMTQLLDPSGAMKSETWFLFVSLCVKGYLAARRYMDGIINTVLMMVESGLPCFSRGDPIGNLRKRFHPEMSEREAANFMIRICADAYDKWSTAGYDLIQYLQQGIEK